VGALAVIWSLYRNDKVFNDKKKGYLPVQYFVAFMVVSSVCGQPQPFYGGVYMVGGHDERFYYPTCVAAYS
jgi:hypothetical protein